ncbi:MAG: methyltransferase domain-containing protein [Planctomycetota bacterium]
MAGVLSGMMKAVHGPVYASRQRALVELIVSVLKPGDRVLDVGCGVGSLGRAIMDDPSCPEGVSVEGLERFARGGEPIPVHAYDGGAMPFEADAYDVVIVADVLHHEADEGALLRECARVSGRLVVVKDHTVNGWWSKLRVSLIDWAANAPHGVPCLFRYHSTAEWEALPGEVGLEAKRALHGVRVYPPFWEQCFGGKLHYFGVWGQPGSSD